MQRSSPFLQAEPTTDAADRHDLAGTVLDEEAEGGLSLSSSEDISSGGAEEVGLLRRQVEELQRYCLGLERSLHNHMATCASSNHNRPSAVSSCSPPNNRAATPLVPTTSATPSTSPTTPPERSGMEAGAFDMWRSPAIGGAAAAAPTVPLMAALPERQEGAVLEENTMGGGGCRKTCSFDGGSEFRLHLDHHSSDEIGIVGGRRTRSKSGDAVTADELRGAIDDEGGAFGEKPGRNPWGDLQKSDDISNGNQKWARLSSADSFIGGGRILSGEDACEGPLISPSYGSISREDRNKDKLTMQLEDDEVPQHQFVWKIGKLSNMLRRMGPLECLVSPRFESATPDLGCVYLMLNTPHNLYNNNNENKNNNQCNNNRNRKTNGSTRAATTTTSTTTPKEVASTGCSSPINGEGRRQEGGVGSRSTTTAGVIIGANGGSTTTQKKKNGSMESLDADDVESSLLFPIDRAKWLRSSFGLYFSCTSGHLVRFKLEVSGRKGDCRLLNSSKNAWEGFASFGLFGDVWDPITDSITIVTSIIKIYPRPQQLSPNNNLQTVEHSWNSATGGAAVAAVIPISLTSPLSPLSIPSPPLFSPTTLLHSPLLPTATTSPLTSVTSSTSLNATGIHSPPQPRPLPPSHDFAASLGDPIYRSSPTSSFSSNNIPWQQQQQLHNPTLIRQPNIPKPRPIGRPPPPLHPLQFLSPIVDPCSHQTHSPPASPPPGFEPLTRSAQYYSLPSPLPPSFSPLHNAINNRQQQHLPSPIPSTCCLHQPISPSSSNRPNINNSALPTSPHITVLPAEHTSYLPLSPTLAPSRSLTVADKNDLSLEVVFRMLLAGCECEELSERERHFQLAVVAAEYNSECICVGIQKVLIHPEPDDKQLIDILYKTLQRDFIPLLRGHNLHDALAFCQCILSDPTKTPSCS
eukprot:GHVS01049773.1.p1 GENE.GHVS01049773.1~~GHVS01049773.1.p1  ORF type:complete len:919 (-),score=186.64 GHVS01049773.1:1154-3910(-)